MFLEIFLFANFSIHLYLVNCKLQLLLLWMSFSLLKVQKWRFWNVYFMQELTFLQKKINDLTNIWVLYSRKVLIKKIHKINETPNNLRVYFVKNFKIRLIWIIPVLQDIFKHKWFLSKSLINAEIHLNKTIF